jgi:hypothetical protein
MTLSKVKKNNADKPYKKLLATSLLLSGALSFAVPVFADGTLAGTPISNTATATYTDPVTDPTGTTAINATSNTVLVTVSEVAGITVVAQPPSNAAPNAGDTLYVDFVITNTGNDPTQFFVPGVATLSNATAFSQGTLQVVAVNGTALGAPVNVPVAGAATGTLLGAGPGSIAANGSITVRVPITVSGIATATTALTVALGNTATANLSNQTYAAGGVNGTPSPAVDVYTQDNPTASATTGELNATAPVNLEREAMSTSGAITVAARLQAFASVLKAASGYTNSGTPNVLTDDVLTYSLALRVENPAAGGGLVASDLQATQINVDSTNVNRVLISDAIPATTQLSTATPTAPAGWTVVYTTSPIGTNALQATWVSPRPGGTITRVGFVNNGPITKGTTVGAVGSFFTFSVTPLATFTGGQVANLGQVFGQSQPGAIIAGTATQIVYDESGDQTSNNGLGGTNPDPTSGGTAAASGGISTGVASPPADGTDPGTGTDPTNIGTTNTGQDTGPNAGTKPAGGESTIYTIAAVPLNGPTGQPGATGPGGAADVNNDFTNRSIIPPAGLNPATALTDPQTPPINFTNTVQNTSSASQIISLLPTPPATATDLPDGTKVTITNGTTTAIYTYTAAGGFVFASGTGGTSATNPVKLTVPGGPTGNIGTYTVNVDLPAAAQLVGYPVPITAFIDQNGNGLFDTSEPNNRTIDRVYTGYLSLIKRSRILPGTGPTVSTADAVLDTNPKSPAPGNIIEYQVSYNNISLPQGTGTNSVVLNAANSTITENGTIGSGGNNWALDNAAPAGVIDTSNVASSATDPTSGAVITFFSGAGPNPTGPATTTTSGTTQATDVTKYVDTIGIVAPGAIGTFTFQRKLN